MTLGTLLLLGLAAQETAVVRNVGGLDGPGGTVKGLVKFTGTKPERKPLTGLAGNAFCKEQCKDATPLEEKWVFGKNGSDDTLANVLVYVSKGLEGKTFEPPKTPAILDQVGCVYTPHVVGVMVGQVLEVRNSDATLHNVMTMPRKNKPFNEGMPVKGGKLEKVFTEPEMKVDLRCFLHPWMLAWVHVMEHPFYAVTGEDGAFTIRGLPPGEYEISVLHETSRFQPTANAMKVKVAEGGTATVDFTYKQEE
ncbi:MAG TPA: carboxypeptidase regulatory-like domain-containing protein [Planctomycetota bacterium]|nr:carboxypeptidase regulatory-like domain-containing protein [Planctomycetota bacterium]